MDSVPVPSSQVHTWRVERMCMNGCRMVVRTGLSQDAAWNLAEYIRYNQNYEESDRWKVNSYYNVS